MTSQKSPWPGPVPYTEDMAELFLGRENELAQILDMLQGERLSLMTASSGAGKTSLLQAGLIPTIRRYRIDELERHPDVKPLAPCPILLNQWIGRAAGTADIDYGQIVLLEAHRHISRSLHWYESELQRARETPRRVAIMKEREHLGAAAKSIENYVSAHGFGERIAGEGADALVWRDSGVPAGTDVKSSVISSVCAAIDIISSEMGSVLLVLDQFEEILLDWRLGEQALAAVESVFTQRPDTARQLISMRHDGLHLVDPLESKGLLRGRRRVRIEPFSPAQTADVLRRVSASAGVSWSTEALPGAADIMTDLIAAFTSDAMAGGRRTGHVNLVGLQIVLNAVFSARQATDGPVTSATIADYCRGLAGEASAAAGRDWLASGRLRAEAPRSWLLRCLKGSAVAEYGTVDARGVYRPQVLPMAARMAWLLVTPTGNKRAMSRSELEMEAYRQELQDMDPHGDDLAGIAREEAWSAERLSMVLKATFEETLERLVRGNILKVRGAGRSSDAAYELVHDQFGRPFQTWATDFAATPEFDLNTLRAIQSRSFRWSGKLIQHDDDGVIHSAVWRDCTLTKIDFSGMTFMSCDFSDSLFAGCTFHKVVFEKCTMSGATFKVGCDFAECTFADCDLGNAVFDKNTVIKSSDFVARPGGIGGLDFALFRGTEIADSKFGCESAPREGADERPLLEMRYLRFVDCAFSGCVAFSSCDLDGCVFTGGGAPMRITGAATFEGCEMQGCEMSNVDVAGSRIFFTACNCRGAMWDRVDAGTDAFGNAAQLRFEDVSLVGATARGCRFVGVEFVNCNASTFVVAGREATHKTPASPSVLSNLHFRRCQAENLSLEGCLIEGDITFGGCALSGATFAGLEESRHVRGNMIFTEDCDLSAAEFRRLTFTGAHQLQIEHCRGQGVFFREVDLNSDDPERPAARFFDTDLTGALFWGCTMCNCQFEGESESNRAEMPTLAIRPLVGKKSQKNSRAARVAGLVFRHVDMAGFVMQDVAISGTLRFHQCDVGYASIGTFSSHKSAKKVLVDGDLLFDDCDMTAIEFSGLEIRDRQLRISASTCTSAMFSGVVFGRLDGGGIGGLVVQGTDFTCARLSSCCIRQATFTGTAPVMSRAVAMTFVGSGGERSELGNVTMKHYIVDGGSFEGVRVSGVVSLQDCSLLRTKFIDIEASAGGRMDVTRSDLLYAQIGRDLLKGREVLVMADPQRAAAEAQAEFAASLTRQGGGRGPGRRT